MKKYSLNSVIVPWDFSEMSMSALETAYEIVESPEKIEVIHVTPYPEATEYGMIWGTLTEDNIRENLHKSFRKEVTGSEVRGIELYRQVWRSRESNCRVCQREECRLGDHLVSWPNRNLKVAVGLGRGARRAIGSLSCPRPSR